MSKKKERKKRKRKEKRRAEAPWPDGKYVMEPLVVLDEMADMPKSEAIDEVAEMLVDGVGEALGVDTGTISEARFEAAVDVAKKSLEGKDAGWSHSRSSWDPHCPSWEGLLPVG
jgi:hypothetical protein